MEWNIPLYWQYEWKKRIERHGKRHRQSITRNLFKVDQSERPEEFGGNLDWRCLID